jgi:2-hydroxychromene-2-carboxylate isomerase
MPTPEIKVYIDYKSPYAYLAVAPAYCLEIEYDVRLNWLPYILEIPLYLGSVESRNEHQWRRVRYAYMDARRLANRRGLIIRGPRKIFDSSLAAMGMLFAKRQNVFQTYNAIIFDRFWKRELNIEERKAVRGVLEEAGADTADLFDYFEGGGRRALNHVIEEAHALGVFGVPMFVLDGELFWGGDSLPLLRERLHQTTPRAVGPQEPR